MEINLKWKTVCNWSEIKKTAHTHSEREKRDKRTLPWPGGRTRLTDKRLFNLRNAFRCSANVVLRQFIVAAWQWDADGWEMWWAGSGGGNRNNIFTSPKTFTMDALRFDSYHVWPCVSLIFFQLRLFNNSILCGQHWSRLEKINGAELALCLHARHYWPVPARSTVQIGTHWWAFENCAFYLQIYFKVNDWADLDDEQS